MIDTVILVETPAEAQSLITHLKGGGLDLSCCVIVGLNPSVRAQMKRHGIACVDTLSFFDNASHARSLRATREINELIQRDFDLDLGDGLRRTYQHTFAFYALAYMRQVIIKMEVLTAVARVYPHLNTIVCFKPPMTDNPMPLHDSLDKSCGLSLKWLGLAEPGADSEGGRGAHSSMLKLMIAWFITRCYSTVARSVSRSRPILFAEVSGKLGLIASALTDRLPRIPQVHFRYCSLGVEQELTRATFWLASALWGGQFRDKLLTMPVHMVGEWLGRRDRISTRTRIERSVTEFLDRHEASLTYQGIPCAGAIKAHRYDLSRVLQDYHDLGLAETHLLKQMRPSVVLSPSGGQEYHILGELSKRQGIPAITIPMKTLTIPEGELEEMGELEIGQVLTEAYSITAAQSRQALGYARHAGYTGRMICSGPLLRARVTTEKRRARRERFFKTGEAGHIIVYAPSMKPFPHSFHVAQTLDEVVSSMQDLATAVRDLPQTYLILRLHPDMQDLKDDLPYLIDMPANATIDTGSRDSIVEVLALADVVVSNMSTVAEEAVCNRIPVLLYDKWARYNHFKAPEVTGSYPQEPSPVYYVAAQQKLVSTLEWVLANHEVGRAFPESVMDKYLYADSRNSAFFDFVSQLVRGVD